MNAIAEEIWTILRDVAAIQRELAESQKDTERRFRETDQQIKETDRQLKETDLKVKEMTASIGRLGNRLGDFIEEAVRPAAVRLFQARGIEVHEVHQNIRSRRGGEGLELDLLVVNDNDIVAIECKSNLSLDDVNEHLNRLGKLKRLLPSYAERRVFGALAAMVIPDNVALYAYRKGLYVIGQNGDDLDIRNDAAFTPAVW